MLWQWSAHWPGLSASKSAVIVSIGRGVLAGAATVLAMHLEGVAVQVHRVEHRRLVLESRTATSALRVPSSRVGLVVAVEAGDEAAPVPPRPLRAAPR